MKLITKTGEYVSPNSTQGTFKDVQISESYILNKPNSKYLAIGLEMFYFKNAEKIVLSTLDLTFLGNTNDETSTFRECILLVSNKNYDVNVPDSKEMVEIDLSTYLLENNGQLPEVLNIVDCGYPSYQSIINYFTGGTFSSPEIKISNKLAIEFILSQKMNGEELRNQFQLVTN